MVSLGLHTMTRSLAASRAKSRPPSSERGRISILSTVLCLSWFATIVTFALHLYWYASHVSIHRTGTVRVVNETTYGFGATKRLVTLNITRIGSVADIDPVDKKMASVTFSWLTDEGESETAWYPIGLELKGDGFGERLQLHFDMELCDDLECREDTNERIFGWQEKYSDYILRGGFLEPGLVRDVAPTVMPHSSYQSKLVEVIIINGDDVTYEGVYNLMQKIGRRMYEKNTNWPSKGKIPKCDGPRVDESDLASTGILFKNEGERDGRASLSDLERRMGIKMIYPKNYAFENVSSKFESYAECQDALRERYLPFYEVMHLRNRTTVPLDYKSIAESFVMVQLMQQADFGYLHASSHWLVRPQGTLLQAGPLYDFDGYWRVMDMESLNFKVHYYQPFLPLWDALGRDPHFLREVRKSNATLEIAYRAVDALYAQQLAHVENGDFDRHIARWPVHGKKVNSVFQKPIQLLVGDGVRTEPTMTRELEFQRARLMVRHNNLQAAIATVTEIKGVHMNWFFEFIKNNLVFTVFGSISVALSLVCCFQRSSPCRCIANMWTEEAPVVVVQQKKIIPSVPMRELTAHRLRV